MMTYDSDSEQRQNQAINQDFIYCFCSTCFHLFNLILFPFNNICLHDEEKTADALFVSALTCTLVKTLRKIKE